MKRALADLMIVILFLAVEIVVLRLFMAEYYFQQGKFYAQRRNIRQAAESYMRAVSLNNREGDYHRALGKAFYQMAQAGENPFPWLRRAGDELLKAVEISPEYPYFWTDLGKVLEYSERKGISCRQNSEECLARAVELDPYNPYFLEIYIRYLLKRSRLEQADRLIPILIERDPRRTNAVASLRVRFPDGFLRMEEFLDDKAEAFFQFARLEQISGKTREAERHFQKAVSLDPEKDTYRINSAKLFLREGKYDEVLDVLKPLLSRDTVNFSSHDLAAIALINKGEVQEAIEIYNRVLELQPRNLMVHLRLADIYYREDDWDKAKQEYTVLYKDYYLHQGLRMKVLYRLGKVHFNAGERSMARHYFEEYLNLNPGNREVRTCLEQLR
jgi:tetratricopeptide (TPR) repeat protein